jgi:S-adenosyl-L-methionine hydrolase (adenosine-forming)
VARPPVVTLTTDFGLNDHFVGAVKGVIVDLVPNVQLVDISHAVQPFDVLDGALAIAQAYSYFPSGTVHMVIVDPGVGSARRPIVLSTEKYLFVAPDNGVLSLIYDREERISVRHITAEHYFLQPVSNTFHARDVFAPIAAYLAKAVDPARMGEEVQDFVRFAAPRPKAVDATTLRGVVLKVDRFGNLITNITPKDAPMLFAAEPGQFRIVIGKKQTSRIHSSYAEGAPGELFGILGSMGYLEVAANRGSAAKLADAVKGTDVNIVLGESAAAANSQ